MNKDLYLSLDQGGHATRAIVFDGEANNVTEHSCPIQTTTDEERVEIDPTGLLHSFRTVLTATFEELGEEAGRVARAGLATQRSNIACWHRHTREPLSPVLSWQDRRAPRYLDGLDDARVHEVTGLFPNPHYGASKLAWCRDHIETVRRAAGDGVLQFGPMASFLAAELTGAQAVADPVNGSRTLLLNLGTGDWDAQLCRHFGIDRRWLPACVPSIHHFGNLAGTYTSLDSTSALPLNVVSGDLSAAAFAHGEPRRDTLYITLGTGAFMQRVEDGFETSHPRLLNGVLWHDGQRGLYSLEGTVNGAGSALSWFAESFGVDPEALFRDLDGYDPETDDLPLFLNGVSGLGSPFWQSDFEPAFIGEAATGDKAFAVLESVIFLLMKNYEAMQSVLTAPERIVAGGGLSNVDGLCRGLAGLTGKPVIRSAEPEATAKGLAYLLAGMPEDWPVRPGTRFDPAPCASLGERYAEWSRQLSRRL